jgi:hypothetical protein
MVWASPLANVREVVVNFAKNNAKLGDVCLLVTLVKVAP